MKPSDLGVSVKDAVKHGESVGSKDNRKINCVALLFVEDGKETVMWRRLLAGSRGLSEVAGVSVGWKSA